MSEPQNPTDDSIDIKIDERYGAFENQGTVVIYDTDQPDNYVQSDNAVTLAEAR